MNERAIRSIGALVGIVLTLQACAGQPAPAVDRAGDQTITLRLASIDDVNGNGVSVGTQAFVDQVRAVSGGHLKLDVSTSYGDGASPDLESQLITDVGSGNVDLAWPSVRAFAGARVHGFEAVEAPMTLTSYAAVKALVQAPVADHLLARLDGTHLVGLGLLVDVLRRPFATQAPLLGPDDWAGERFRTFHSPVESEAITALGGTPVDLGASWIDEIQAGTLRGAEFDIPQYQYDGFSTEAPYVTANVVLWPKVYVLVVNRQRLDSLTDEQRGWLRDAAQAATKASVDAAYDESSIAASLCKVGVRFVSATDNEIAAIKAKLAPVITSLAADPVNGPLLQEIQAIAAAHPGVDVPNVPADCARISAASPAPSAIPTTTATIPDGTYRQTVTQADLDAAGVGNGPGFTGIWTLKIADGTYALSCNFAENPARDCGNGGVDGGVYEGGYLRGAGNEVWFVGDAATQSKVGCGGCQVLTPYGFTWTLDGKTLTFSDPRPNLIDQHSLAPWTRIGG